MILAMDVLRWLTVRALMGKTWAGDRVFDSPSQPADLRMQEEQAPYIGVFTDDADVDLGDEQSLAGGAATVMLVIEIAMGEPTLVDEEDYKPPAGGSPVQISSTDSGLEANIGLIARQANQALLATDNPWSELWKILTSPGREKVEIRRGGYASDNRDPPAVRFAARLMRYTLRVLNEPVYGSADLDDPENFWSQFLAAAEADEMMAVPAAFVRSHIEFAGAPLPNWREAQKIMMLTRQGVAGIYHADERLVVGMGISPVVIPDETEAPMSHQGTIADDRGGPVVVVPEGDPDDLVSME